MNLPQIKQAISQGKTVHWGNDEYTVIRDNLDRYLIIHTNGSTIGLTHQDNTTLNGKENEFYIKAKES